MEVIRQTLPRDYELIQFGDMHVGSPNVSEDHILEMVEYIASHKNVFGVGIGDAIECITANDKRFAHTNLPYKTPHQQADRVIELLSPIKDRILAWGTGNHEYKQFNVADFGKMMADGLGVPYGMYCFKLEAYSKKGQLMHKMFFTHGSGHLSSNAKDDIQREANIKAALKNKLARSGFGDCIYMGMGHVHRGIVVAPTVQNKLYLTTDKAGKVKQHFHVLADQTAQFIPPDSRWYSSSPSFMKLYSAAGTGYVSYAEVAGYEPSQIGYNKITVNDGDVVNVEIVHL